jgi:hypothetical protein
MKRQHYDILPFLIYTHAKRAVSNGKQPSVLCSNSCKLALVQVVVAALLSKQFIVVACLDYLSALDYNDLVRVADR